MNFDIPPASKFEDQKPKSPAPVETVFDEQTGLPSELLSEIENYKKDRIEKFNSDLGFLKKWISLIFKNTPKFPIRSKKDGKSRCCQYAVNIIASTLYSNGYKFEYGHGTSFDEDGYPDRGHVITIDLI